MTRSQRMKPVMRVAESREREAAKRLGESQQILEQQEQRLQELQSYRADYQRYCQERGTAGITAARFLELQRFMQQLDEAIRQQVQIIEQAEHSRDRQRQHWYDTRGKIKQIDKVIARYRDEEETVARKREQKEIDELAQRKRPHGGGFG